jgi:nucleoside-diphosphate-sugar epimerase
MTAKRVLIVGCGYVGLPLGQELVRRGHEVFGLRRSLEAAGTLQAAGIQPLAGDITRLEELARLPGPFDWVVNCAAPGESGAAGYREVYLTGTRHLLEWLAAQMPGKYVYSSSTGVYGQDDGSLVKESSPTAPASETGQILVETERLLFEAAREGRFPAVILRVAGIYGPDRTHYLNLFLKNEARLEGDGRRLLNMVHRDDVVGCLVAALESGRAGEVYNAVDDEPVPQVHFFRWLSETLGKWMPPSQPEEVGVAVPRRVTNKRVSNRKLKMELGYQFKYPTFRQGYTAEIQRLDRAGLLEFVPEPR